AKGRRQQRFHQAHLTHRLAHHRTPPSCFTRIESQQHGQGQGFAAVSLGSTSTTAGRNSRLKTTKWTMYKPRSSSSSPASGLAAI
ncbi:MAG TPA: hypothetical protein VHL31_07770, partial [Geminicoccus sp.]|uniref:hypothetical protein n=1 Tax=Geminicoccus sp. TaxID=2024832 RepID=UPI002E356947